MKNIFRSFKSRWLRYLKKIAKANEKEFGDRVQLNLGNLNKSKPDCIDSVLNKI